MRTPREIIAELAVRDEPAFYNARINNFFTELADAGYVIAPKEPTDEMYRAALAVSRSSNYEADDTIGGAVYRAMLSAIPSTPN